MSSHLACRSIAMIATVSIVGIRGDEEEDEGGQQACQGPLSPVMRTSVLSRTLLLSREARMLPT